MTFPAPSLEMARAAKKRALETLSPLVGDDFAVGVTNLGDEGYGIKVNLPREPKAGVEFPDEIDGVSVCVEVVGRIVKR